MKVPEDMLLLAEHNENEDWLRRWLYDSGDTEFMMQSKSVQYWLQIYWSVSGVGSPFARGRVMDYESPIEWVTLLNSSDNRHE